MKRQYNVLATQLIAMLEVNWSEHCKALELNSYHVLVRHEDPGSQRVSQVLTSSSIF